MYHVVLTGYIGDALNWASFLVLSLSVEMLHDCPDDILLDTIAFNRSFKQG